LQKKRSQNNSRKKKIAKEFSQKKRLQKKPQRKKCTIKEREQMGKNGARNKVWANSGNNNPQDWKSRTLACQPKTNARSTKELRIK
jgi:hypothetical protein